MAYTLISMLGTGVYKDNNNKGNGYKQTTYKFDEETKYTTSCFLDALVNCKYREFDKIIIVGTTTSAWNILLDPHEEGMDEETQKLWDEINSVITVENGSNEVPCGICEEQKEKIEKIATKKFNAKVILKYHTANIDESTAAELFECYNSIIPLIDKDSDVLFDITHGFRSMPLLLYQALQFSLINDNYLRKIEIVYGELKRNEDSPVRCLNKYWTYTEISNATSLFKRKLDGFYLAELLKETWPDGAKAIKTISEIVQTNFSLKLTNADENERYNILAYIETIIKEYDSNLPSWTLEIKNLLQEFANLKSTASQAATLLNYSKYLFEHDLKTQACIALQVCVETAIAEKYASPEDKAIGNYDWWMGKGQYEDKPNGKYYYNKIKKDNKDNKKISKLEHVNRFRNQIAHGGSRNRQKDNSMGNFPSCASPITKDIYQSSVGAVEALLDLLKLN